MSHYLEKLIAKQCIADLLAAGWLVSVNDGEETTVLDSTDPETILAAMFTTDEDYLYVRAAKLGGEPHDPRFFQGLGTLHLRQ
jgi:hypothetical protein